ncbi:hypothetical protein SEA_FINKLE_61 [Gordonia phage Finkle]|uniref:Uncharacterized protein n=1 Tax=Gordonia phage Finkle TaxID=2926099 RepID=A0A9E7SXI9_9CAUD|nr:hypothetical protein QEH33_gp61 [Gordonia phage Finkle]UTN92975.1 hypothetical protein SEA_FINKLE_61 [Gordonia phage Finkle]
MADLRLGWWVLYDPGYLLDPENFLTKRAALDRAELHPLWRPIRWQLYDPDGHLALSRRTTR